MKSKDEKCCPDFVFTWDGLLYVIAIMDWDGVQDIARTFLSGLDARVRK